MVRRIINVLQKEVRGLHEAAYLLGTFALLSQILALVRDRLLTNHFGAGETLDIYYAAFRIPDFIFITIASMVSLSVLIPFLVEKVECSDDDAKHFINGVFTFFSILIFVTGVIMFFLTPKLLSIIFPGFVGVAYNNLVTITRILLLQPILLGFSSFFASIVHVYKKFILYAISPLLYNIGIIVGVLYFYDIFGIKGLAYGVLLGAFMHMGIQIPFILKMGYIPKIIFKNYFNDIKKVVFLSLPRTLALSANQIAVIFLLGLASLMGVGSISIFNLGFNLQSVPLAIIGASYSVAAFPTLARLFSNGDKDKFFDHITIAARHIIFWAFPATALFIVLRAQIVRVILGSGEFTWSDTSLTAAVLALFSVSLVAQSLVLLFVRGYYAAGETRKPVIINVFSSALIAIFAVIFSKLFAMNEMFRYFIESILDVGGVTGTSVLMLPLSFSVALIINVVLFWIFFQKDFKKFSITLSATFLQSLTASIVLGFATYKMLDVFDEVFNMDMFWGIFLQGAISGIIGIIFWAITLKFLKNEELGEVFKSMHKKFWKSEVISSE